MNTTTFASNRFNDIVARQRSSRLRDLSFSLLLALGFGLSLGALRAAAAQAAAPVSTAPSLTAPDSTPATAAATPACDVDLSC
jgi:hypothetical protein